LVSFIGLRDKPSQPWTERAIRTVLALGLLGTALIISNGIDHFRLPKELVFRGEAILLLMLAAFWWTSSRRSWSISMRPEFVAAFLAIGWAAVTTILSTNRLLSTDSLITVVAAAIIFIATCVALQSGSMFLVDVLMFAACCNATLTILQELKIWTPYTGARDVSTHMGSVGFLGNPNDVGMYLCGATLLAVAVAVHMRKRRRWIYAAIVMLLMAGIIASGTKTVVAALGAALIVFGLAHSRRAAIGVAVLLVAIAIAIAVPSTPLGSGVRTVAHAVAERDYAQLSSERLIPFLTAVEMVRSHPLTGVGPGCFKYLFMSYRLSLEEKYPPAWTKGYPMNWAEVHNDHLQIAAETGVPGYLLFLGAIGLIGGAPRREKSSAPLAVLARSMRWPFAVLVFVLCIAQFPLELAAARLMLLTLSAVCLTWSGRDDDR